MTLTDAVLMHSKRYPQAKLQDYIKLVYQNEFAGGHLISDRDKSYLRLKKEYEQLNCIDADQNLLFEEIGNGLCRLQLKHLDTHWISLETVNRMFVETAECVKGSRESFEAKLLELLHLTQEGQVSLDYESACQEMKAYRDMGFPVISHSERYREYYHPAYRIIDVYYKTYFNVISKIEALLRSKERILVAIDGNCAAGKSSLAERLSHLYDCNVFHMDDFFLPLSKRTLERLQEPGGNIDRERFKEEIMEGLLDSKTFFYQSFNCKTQSLMSKTEAVPKKLNIIEGSYSLHPELQEYYDLKIFLSIDVVTQSERILQRNGETVHKQFQERWIPMENRYFEAYRIREVCDVVY